VGRQPFQKKGTNNSNIQQGERHLEIVLGDVTIRTRMGDITELAIDAIANAANSDLWMGSGVAGAIKRRGGQEIEQEAMSLGPIRPGEAVLTTGGHLPARYVIHCAGMAPGEKATFQNVALSVQNALSIASEKNIKSVAFPAIGAGVGGLSQLESAEAIVTSTIKYSKAAKSVKEITLVGLDRNTCECFDKAFEEIGE
jgi:O-acetyl-ADP-ribose deacetylase (regulator of RNase III)